MAHMSNQGWRNTFKSTLSTQTIIMDDKKEISLDVLGEVAASAKLAGFPVSKSPQGPLTILRGAQGADRLPVRALLAGSTDTTFLEVRMVI